MYIKNKQKQQPVTIKIKFVRPSNDLTSKKKYIKNAKNNSIESIISITKVLFTDWNNSFQYCIKYCMVVTSKIINKEKLLIVKLFLVRKLKITWPFVYKKKLVMKKAKSIK